MSLFDVGTMTELLNRSLTGGVVILAVLALRLMMRRFPRKYVCILWLAAFGRLLFSIPVPAASSLFPAAEPLQQAAVEVSRWIRLSMNFFGSFWSLLQRRLRIRCRSMPSRSSGCGWAEWQSFF